VATEYLFHPNQVRKWEGAIIKDASGVVFQHFHFYNKDLLHQVLGCRTPPESYFAYQVVSKSVELRM